MEKNFAIHHLNLDAGEKRYEWSQMANIVANN